MNQDFKNPISHMLQGLAHWMAYRKEMSSIEVIEADLVFVATDLLRASLQADYSVRREITGKSFPCLDNRRRVDLGIYSKTQKKYCCLIEFKLADATNGGYKNDVNKLKKLKDQSQDIDCLVVILYRKLCDFTYPKEFVNSQGKAQRKHLLLDNGKVSAVVRRVCHSCSSKTSNNSLKAICIEVL